jgi:hypothetical protein
MAMMSMIHSMKRSRSNSSSTARISSMA